MTWRQAPLYSAPLFLAQRRGAIPALRLDQFPDRLDGASAELDLGEGFGKVLACRIGVQIFAENPRAIRGRFRDDAVEPRGPDRRVRRLALRRGLTSGPFDPRRSRFALDHDPRALGTGFDQQSRRSFRQTRERQDCAAQHRARRLRQTRLAGGVPAGDKGDRIALDVGTRAAAEISQGDRDHGAQSSIR